MLDLPHVLPGAEELLARAGVRDRVSLVSGNFFESVPAGGDVYLLSMVLHDWTDEEAGRLLEAIRRAIPSGGRLLIIDAVLPEGDTPHFGKLLDLTMLAMMTGRERTEAEFAELLDRAGFRLADVGEMAAPTSLIEARPV